MAFEPLGLSGESVQATAERPLQSLGSIWRQERGKGGLDDKGLRDALACGVIGKPDRQVGWQAEGVLGAHGLEVDAIARIHGRLAGQAARLGTQHAGAHGLVIWLVLAKGKLR